jgi:hypothetical protein
MQHVYNLQYHSSYMERMEFRYSNIKQRIIYKMGINETWRSEMQMLTPRLLFVIWFIKTLRYTNPEQYRTTYNVLVDQICLNANNILVILLKTTFVD